MDRIHIYAMAGTKLFGNGIADFVYFPDAVPRLGEAQAGELRVSSYNAAVYRLFPACWDADAPEKNPSLLPMPFLRGTSACAEGERSCHDLLPEMRDIFR